jgi:hypothetical protein
VLSLKSVLDPEHHQYFEDLVALLTTEVDNLKTKLDESKTKLDESTKELLAELRKSAAHVRELSGKFDAL